MGERYKLQANGSMSKKKSLIFLFSQQFSRILFTRYAKNRFLFCSGNRQTAIKTAGQTFHISGQFQIKQFDTQAGGIHITSLA